MNRTLAILLLTYSTTALAQFSRNDIMFNGTFLLNSESNPHGRNSYPTKTFSFSSRLSAGLFLNKNFEVGGQAGYSIISRQENVRSMSVPLDFKTVLFSSGIYGQRYFTLSRKLFFTIFTSITFSSGTDTYISSFPIPADLAVTSSKIFQISTSIRPTIIFFPLPRLGIQGGLGSIRYLYSNNLSTRDKQNDIELNYWPIAIGLTYSVGKKNSE